MKDGGPKCLAAVGLQPAAPGVFQGMHCALLGVLGSYILSAMDCRLSKMICCGLDHRFALGHVGNNFLPRTNLGRVEPCYAKAGNMKG